MTTTTTAYEPAAAVPAAPLSRRGEQREDARLRAELELARDAARAQLRREDDRAWAEEHRQARADKTARKADARAELARARSARTAWLRDHKMDLLFAPAIVVPGALAWEAMAAYGAATWGPLGIALPLFSETAMWAFDAGVTIRRRRDPGKPVWHLQLGIAIFAVYGAALNFLHGVAPTTAHRGLAMAVSMALVSVAGVTAHQLVTAGPRRSRAERELDRFRRDAERRQSAARKAAARMALVDIDEQGHADLVYEPGTYRLTRSLTGGRRLAAPKGRLALATRTAPARPPAVPVWEPEPEEPAGAAYGPGPQPARAPVVPSAAVAGQPATAAEAPATRGLDLRDAVAGTAGFPPPEFYGPDADRAWSGPVPEAARDDSGPEDDDDDDAAIWAAWPKEAVAAQLAPQIRAAAAAGTTWKPDYEQLIARTDRSKRTCESIVSIARGFAASPEEDPEGATESDGGGVAEGDGESSQSSRDSSAIVPDAARMPVFRAAGGAAGSD
jgi:hypothetical protein